MKCPDCKTRIYKSRLKSERALLWLAEIEQYTLCEIKFRECPWCACAFATDDLIQQNNAEYERVREEALRCAGK